MKRSNIVLEPWSTKEKLCLSSAVVRNGDQNWMSVSRVLRVFGEKDRPPDWYSQKQCALQYEALINNVASSKRKKRSDKGVETEDPPCESIVKKLQQERLEELDRLIEEDKKLYLQLKKEIEDIESGRADDRLDEYEREIEEEMEKETSRGSILRQHEERNRLEGGRTSEQQQQESKVSTSPLLTSLLQSPSNYRGASMHSPLSSSPSHSKLNDSPTLSRLLETPAKKMEPTILFPSSIDKESSEALPSQQVKLVSDPSLDPCELPSVPRSEVIEEIPIEVPVLEEIKTESCKEKDGHDHSVEKEAGIADTTVSSIQDVEVEIAAAADKIMASGPEEKPVAQDAEKEENRNCSQDTSIIEEQRSITELDCQTVNMIVAGEGMISVNHDISSEHLEEVTSSDIQHKDDSEAAESVKEDSLDGVSEDVLKAVSEADSSQGALNFIIGSQTPKDNFVVNVCSTPENDLDEDSKTEVKEPIKTAPDADSVEGSMVVEEEVDTTVHEVELLVTPATASGEDSTQDMDITTTNTPDTESQEDEEISRKEDSIDDHNLSKEASNGVSTTSKNVNESKPASPAVNEEEEEKRVMKRRLISGSVCSDSKPSSPASHMLEDSKEYRSWKKSIMLVHNRLATHKYASMFLKPITNEQAPAYDTVVHRPVDLFTIKKRIESGELRTTVEFQRDLLLMFQNAIMYNNSQSLVYKMASIMQNECLPHIELMVEAMGEGVPWRKDPISVDKLHTRARGEAPKRKRNPLEDPKIGSTPKRRKESSS